jgi:predicted hotdog family 3-hydroxylacyl-ACP dehydratase
MTPEEFDISELLPQRDPFIMVDRLIYYDPVITKTIFRVNDNNLFCHDGIMEESGMIEIIAQTCAARMGYREKTEVHRDGVIKIGVIGMVKKMEIFRNPYVGEELETTIEIMADAFNATLVETKIESGNETLATCEMKIYLTDKAPG